MTTSAPPRPHPDALELSTRQVVALYTALRLRANGLAVTTVNPVAVLNAQTGRSWDARRWLDLLRPYYLAITQP